MKYIFCLGNEPIKYHNTRHNIGYLIANLLSFHNIQVIKPTGYINDSGKFIKKFLEKKQNIDIKNDILIIVDDYMIEFGKIKLKLSGSSGGHNGLKDIEKELNTQDYPRLRIGIGSNFEKGKLIEYVLENFSNEELKKIPYISSQVQNIIQSIEHIGFEKTKSTFSV
jgi:PTH1 family peptidyl-tRNA hydrolase